MAYRLAERLRDNVAGERYPIAGAFHLGEITLGSKLAGQLLDPARFREDYSVNIVFIQQAEGGRIDVREADTRVALRAGDVVWLNGTREKLNRFERDCGSAG